MKKTETDRHCDGRSYVITHDLGERVESLRFVGLKTPDASDPFFARFHQKLQDAVKEALPHLQVVSFSMKKLVEDVWVEALRMQRNLKDAVVISSCAEFAAPRHGHVIEINRIVNAGGEIIGLGPRPGTVSLDKQINSIAAMTNGNPVVLVEDGIFTGSTMVCLLKHFQERRVKVVAVVAGICFAGSKARIRKVFDGEIVIVREVEKPYEWVPDHDFVPFAPNCGRVLGNTFGRELFPHYTHEGLSYCFPYILPFGDPVKWASIPKENSFGFSRMCLNEAHSLFSTLDKMNGRKITPVDLLGSMPRISVPMTIGGNGGLPNVDISISDFLNEVRHELC